MDDQKLPPKFSVATEEQGEKLQEKMEEIRIKEKERLAQSKAAELGLPYINLKGFPVAPEVLSLITKDIANQSKVIPFFKDKNEIRAAVLDPFEQESVRLLDVLGTKYKSRIMPYIVSEHSFDLTLALYDAIPHPREYVSGVKIDQKEFEGYQKRITNLASLAEIISAAPFAELVTIIIAGALQTRASDIHIESEAKDIKVRYRIDGVLHDISSLDRKVWKQLINRLKLLAKVKLNVVGKPQDGRFTIHLASEEIEVRVSFLPTGYGESVVMRVLRSSAASLQMEELGLRGPALELLQQEIKRPNGMLLTTGPTGSGKTTSLYAVLNEINTPEKKIITLENPIEYRLEGVNQSQVDRVAGYTFAKGLRSIMRQDPDIVMVGEIRDEETAEIAVNAALTGHYVLSTLHTNNAAGAIPRFIAMNVKSYLLAPALNTIIAQRLVRRICTDCKEERELDPETMKRVKEIFSNISPKAGVRADLENLHFFVGKGCETCQGIGYRGRIGIYEIFTMNPDIEKLILDNKVSEFEMERIAIEHGMITMAQDGLLKALDGITSVEEILKVATQ